MIDAVILKKSANVVQRPRPGRVSGVGRAWSASRCSNGCWRPNCLRASPCCPTARARSARAPDRTHLRAREFRRVHTLDRRREPGSARLVAGSLGPREIIASIKLRTDARNGRPGVPDARDLPPSLRKCSGSYLNIWIKLYVSYNYILVRVPMPFNGAVRAPSPARAGPGMHRGARATARGRTAAVEAPAAVQAPAARRRAPGRQDVSDWPHLRA